MLYAKPSSAAIALHRKCGIIRGDSTGGRATPSTANAPTLARRNAAGIKISMAQKPKYCNLQQFGPWQHNGPQNDGEFFYNSPQRPPRAAPDTAVKTSERQSGTNLCQPASCNIAAAPRPLPPTPRRSRVATLLVSRKFQWRKRLQLAPMWPQATQ